MQMAKATRFRLCPGFKDVPETLPPEWRGSASVGPAIDPDPLVPLWRGNMSDPRRGPTAGAWMKADVRPKSDNVRA